jgi:hypothetical protein
MKEIKNFELKKALSYDALYNSMLKCKKGVIWKGSVASFYFNCTQELSKLENELADGTYMPRKPRFFTIYEPKQREIMSIAFRDRIVERSLNDNVIYPKIKNKLIYDNGACQKGKGTDFSRNRLIAHLRKYYMNHGTNEGYVLQCDISKYYPSMRHDVAEKIFHKMLDKETADMACFIINNRSEKEVGYSAGNQTIQTLGILYLNDLDHYIKEKLRFKRYVRYMDDFILMSNDKEELIKTKEIIEKELDKIGLKFNTKKTKIYKISKGIPFLGFKFVLTNKGKVLMFVADDKLKSKRRKLKNMIRASNNGKFSKEVVDSSYNGWRVHISKGNTKQFVLRTDKWYNDLKRGALSGNKKD